MLELSSMALAKLFLYHALVTNKNYKCYNISATKQASKPSKQSVLHLPEWHSCEPSEYFRPSSAESDERQTAWSEVKHQQCMQSSQLHYQHQHTYTRLLQQILWVMTTEKKELECLSERLWQKNLNRMHSTDVGHCYRQCGMVHPCAGHNCQPHKNGRLNQDAV